MKTEAGKIVLERVRKKVARETREDAMEAESVDMISPLRVITLNASSSLCSDSPSGKILEV
jgi:hypothetical protein